MSLMHRSLHIAGRQVTNIVVMTAVIMLVCVGLAYWFSHAIAERKDEIAAWASEKPVIRFRLVKQVFTGLICFQN